MMKKILFLGYVIASLTACSSVSEQNMTPTSVGMANPASQYCIDQGGQLDMKNEAQGQVGYCQLPDGKVVEEWALFRENQPKCVPEEAQKLIGQSQLTEAQIKDKTKAEVVRQLGPDQMMTMDYRENRVTVIIDPKTQQIVKANCG